MKIGWLKTRGLTSGLPRKFAPCRFGTRIGVTGRVNRPRVMFRILHDMVLGQD